MALQEIEDGHILDRLQIEFAAMCNRIMSADSLVARDREALVATVKKACGYLDIGLEELEGDEPRKAAELIASFPLARIFRVGYGAALALKWKVHKWFQKSWFVTQDLETDFWGDAWSNTLEGLIAERPLFCGGFTEEGEPYREFRSVEDIIHCQKVLDQMIALDELLSVMFPPHRLENLSKSFQPLTFKNLLLTCWAQQHLGLDEAAEPLDAEEMRSLFDDLWGGDNKPYHAQKKMRESFSAWLAKRSGKAAGDVDVIATDLMDELENEYGSVSVNDLDPVFVKHFLVKM